VRLGSLADRGRQTIIGSAVSGVGGQALVWVLGLPTSILIARALGPEGRGEYYLPVTAAAVALVAFHLSFESANAVAFADRRRSLAELSRSMGLAALLLGPLAVLSLVAVFLPTQDEIFAGLSLGQFLIVAATVPLALHSTWLAGIYVLAKQLPRTQLALVAGALAYLVGAAVLYAAGSLGVTEVLVLYSASIALPWLLLVLWSRTLAPLAPAAPARAGALRELAALGLKLHLGQLFIFLLLRFDIFLVSLYLDTEDVGVYSLAVLLADLAVVVTYPLVLASLPFQAEVSAAESVDLAFKTARFNFASGVLLALAFAATLWFLIPFVYGEGFSDAYAAVLLRLPGICALAAARPLILLVQRQGRPLTYSGLAIAAFLLDIGLNLILLPSVGMLGASIAVSVALMFLAAALLGWGLRVAGEGPGALLLPQRQDRESMARAVARVRGLARRVR
jgi:O-antigen/teichoic acid export membrane protein